MQPAARRRRLAARLRALRGRVPGRPSRRGDLLLPHRLAHRLAVGTAPRRVAVHGVHHPHRRHLAGQRLPARGARQPPRSAPTTSPSVSRRSRARSRSTPSAATSSSTTPTSGIRAARATDDAPARRPPPHPGRLLRRDPPRRRVTASTTSSRTPPAERVRNLSDNPPCEVRSDSGQQSGAGCSPRTDRPGNPHCVTFEPVQQIVERNPQLGGSRVPDAQRRAFLGRSLTAGAGLAVHRGRRQHVAGGVRQRRAPSVVAGEHHRTEPPTLGHARLPAVVDQERRVRRPVHRRHQRLLHRRRLLEGQPHGRRPDRRTRTPSSTSGKALLGIGSPDITAPAILKGAPLKIIAVLFQKNPFCVMSLASNPHRPPRRT